METDRLRLVFHLNFKNGPDAVVAAGDAEASVTGTPVYKSEPWQMWELDNRNAKCLLRIPSNAEIVLDELKIWERR